MKSTERYRMARNVHTGMEVRVLDKETGEPLWLAVTSAMTITSPAKVTLLALANGDRFSVAPTSDVMSR